MLTPIFHFILTSFWSKQWGAPHNLKAALCGTLLDADAMALHEVVLDGTPFVLALADRRH